MVGVVYTLSTVAVLVFLVASGGLVVYYWGVFVPALHRARRKAHWNYHRFVLRSREREAQRLSGDNDPHHYHYSHPHGTRSHHYPRSELLLDRLSSLLALLSLAERQNKRAEEEKSLQLMWRDMNRTVVMQCGDSHGHGLSSDDQGRKTKDGRGGGDENRDGRWDIHGDEGDSVVSLLDSTDHTDFAVPGVLDKKVIVPEGGQTQEGNQPKQRDTIAQTDKKKDGINLTLSMPGTDTPPDPSASVAVEATRNKFLDRFISHVDQVDAHAHVHVQPPGEDDEEVYMFPVELSRIRCQGGWCITHPLNRNP